VLPAEIRDNKEKKKREKRKDQQAQVSSSRKSNRTATMKRGACRHVNQKTARVGKKEVNE
jgi:hypothetical protein